jgi:undecaprenyl-diphosphatase
MQLLQEVAVFIAAHAGWAYGAIFLISLSESLAMVGLIVPGTTILFGVGAILATGSLAMKPALLAAVAGAVAGDGISYWIGRVYRESLRRLWPFSRYPAVLEKGKGFFFRHGGKSIFLGRFVGPVRPVVPLVAGMLGMAPTHFLVANVLSAVGWALACLLPGAFLGASLAVAGAVSSRLAVLAALLLGVIWGFVWLGRLAVRLIARRGPVWTAALADWAASEKPTLLVLVPARRALGFLFRRQRGEELLFAGLALTLLAAVWGFLGVLQDVLARDPLVLADQSVYHLLQSLRTPWADRIFITVTELGDASVNILLAATVLLALLAKRCYRTAGFWTVSVLGALAGVEALKWMIHRPRPVAVYQGISAYGFPSGHTTMSVVLYGFLAIVAARNVHGARRWGSFVAALLISLLIGVSRLYLGVHWLSDVLGGFFIGSSWAAVLGISYLKGAKEKVPRRWLVLTAASVFAVAGGWHAARHSETDLARYAPRQTLQFMSLETWQSGGWQDLPAWRIDLAGEPEQPLTFQWAGSPAALSRYLSTSGWQQPPSIQARSFVAMLSPDTSIQDLPVLPRLHSGRAEKLRLVSVSRSKSRRWVLRLWPSDVRVPSAAAPLFVGTLEVQQRRHIAGLVTAAEDTGDYDRPRKVFEHLLRKRFAVEAVHRPSAQVAVQGELSRLHWAGRVLLAWEAPAGGAADVNARSVEKTPGRQQQTGKPWIRRCSVASAPGAVVPFVQNNVSKAGPRHKRLQQKNAPESERSSGNLHRPPGERPPQDGGLSAPAVYKDISRSVFVRQWGAVKMPIIPLTGSRGPSPGPGRACRRRPPGC